MTQQIIDIGANANDGTGEPLRQAFQAVNDNFSNIWAAGPVDSQVIISNNVVSTNVTNLDLILAGNGIGNVTVESTLIPGIDSVYNLGSPSNYFDTAYSRYYYGNGAYLTGVNRGGSGGNVYFRATPPLNPNIGDIWIDSDTAVQYLYFNDNTANIWAEMEAYQSFGSATGGSGNGVPGGSNTQIQFNSNGAFGASSALTFDVGTYTLGTVNLQTSDATVYGTLVAVDVVATGNINSDYFIANSSNLNLQNFGGDVVVTSVDHTWIFANDGNLQLPAASVESTPYNPGFANQTQKSIKGAIETVAGNPTASYTNSLGQPEIIWTATNAGVTAARMTLRVQYGDPVTGMEMCDIVLAKEGSTNANVSYVVSNRIKTNNSLGYANVTVDLDGSNNLVVIVTNGSSTSEYYTYSITEFNTTID